MRIPSLILDIEDHDPIKFVLNNIKDTPRMDIQLQIADATLSMDHDNATRLITVLQEATWELRFARRVATKEQEQALQTQAATVILETDEDDDPNRPYRPGDELSQTLIDGKPV